MGDWGREAEDDGDGRHASTRPQPLNAGVPRRKQGNCLLIGVLLARWLPSDNGKEDREIKKEGVEWGEIIVEGTLAIAAISVTQVHRISCLSASIYLQVFVRLVVYLFMKIFTFSPPHFQKYINS